MSCSPPRHYKMVGLQQLATVHTLGKEVKRHHRDAKLACHAHLVRVLALLCIAHHQMRCLRQSTGSQHSAIKMTFKEASQFHASTL
ncbi:MAG: hypothetical protein MPJ22_13560 [Pirellulales bacterium]|nr:hypothetical protein [Pirellulales bacterium]